MQKSPHFSIGLCLLAILLSSGCVESISPPTFTEEPTITFNPNPQAPLAGIVRFKANKPVTTAIRVKDGEWERELIYDESHNPEDGLPVIGLVPDKTHELRIFIHDSFGRLTESANKLEFHTLALPSDPTAIPPIQLTVSTDSLREEGIWLVNPRRRRAGDTAFGQDFGLLLGLNIKGKVVWYYRTDSRISDFQRLENGNIIYLTQDYRMVEIDWLGNVQSEWYATGRPDGPANGIPIETMAIHHEIDELPNGNLVVLGVEKRSIDNYYTSETDAEAPRKTQEVMGDQIIEFQRDGTVVWQWNAFDHLDPSRIGYNTFDEYWWSRGFPNTVDWTHGNGLMYDEQEDAYLVSLRYQDAVLSIDRASSEINWILGEPTSWPENLQDRLFELQGDGSWFYQQHGPVPTASGNMLIYDNGNFGARPFTPAKPNAELYSRAVEYEIDPANGTARQVWISEEANEDAVLSLAMGDIDWLPEKNNVLVTYGMLGPNDSTSVNWTRIREYSHSQPADLLAEIVFRDTSAVDPVGWTIFGTELVPQIIPCNYCYAYPGPPRPRRRPF